MSLILAGKHSHWPGVPPHPINKVLISGVYNAVLTVKFCPSCTTNYKLRLGWFFSVKNLAEYVLEFAIVVNVDVSNSTELRISRSQSPWHCSLKPKSKTALDSYKYKR